MNRLTRKMDRTLRRKVAEEKEKKRSVQLPGAFSDCWRVESARTSFITRRRF